MGTMSDSVQQAGQGVWLENQEQGDRLASDDQGLLD